MALSIASGGYLQHASTINVPGVLSFWMRTTGGTTKTAVVGKHNSATRFGWILIMNNTANKLTLVGYDGTTDRVNITGTTTINDGNWHHVALNLWFATGVSSQLYIDGALEAQQTPASPFGGNSDVLRFGKSIDGFWGNYVGDFAEITMWSGGGGSTRLTADQVAGLAAGLNPLSICLQEVNSRMPLNGNSTDVVGTYAQPTLSSTSWTTAHPRVFPGV